MTEIDIGKMQIVAAALTPILAEVFGEFHTVVLAFEKATKTGKRDDLRAAMDALTKAIASGPPSVMTQLISKVQTICARLGTPSPNVHEPSSRLH